MIAADGSVIWLQDIVSVMVENDQPSLLKGIMIDITKRKLAEQKIIDSERRYRSLFEQNLAGVFRSCVDGRILACNDAFVRMMGYDSQEEIIQMHANGLYFAGKDRDDFISLLRQQKKLYDYEIVVKRKNGEPLYVIENLFLFTDPITGEEIYDGVMIDFTERKLAEQKIIDSERRYRSLFEQNLAGVYRTTTAGMILACNNAFATMLGYASADELQHRNASELYYSVDDRRKLIACLREQKKIYNYEFVLKRRDSDPLFILANTSLSIDPVTGEEIIDGVMIDISEAKKTAAELQKSYEEVVANEALLKSAEKLAHFGSWSVDMISGGLIWSDEIYRIYGYEPGTVALTFDFFLSHVYPDDLEYIKQELDALGSHTSSRKIYFRIIDTSGEIRYIHCEYQVERDPDGKPIKVTGFNMDVTEKIQLEEKLVEEKIKKQQEITTAVITAQEQERKRLGEELHDNINQVLATAKLYIESAMTDSNVRPDLLTDSKNYIVSAINGIRDLSRSLLPPSLGVVSLTEALYDLLETINRTKQLTCITDCEGLDETPISDKLKLTIFRIVQEQMNNVISHANAKTAIVKLINKDNHLHLSIKDDGVGFDTTQKRTGVGLQNITSRAELLNGNVVIDSVPGKGCELLIDFDLN